MEFVGVLTVLLSVICLVYGHGRLIQPVGRATMWRYGYNTPVDYNDHQLYCGGRGHQWNKNGGKCGVCGDPYDQPRPRDHEAGGKYGLGIIVERYLQGQVIEAKVELTANHKGNFEFRICATNHPKVPATEECLNKNLLSDITGRKKFFIERPGRDFSFKLKLPPNLVCSLCVFQWKYEAAQNSGNQQEHFINCADVAIDSRNQQPNKPFTYQPYIPTTTPILKPQNPSKPYKPITSKPYEPPTQKPYKPYVPQTPRPYKPYVPPTQKPYKPYVPQPTQKSPYRPQITTALPPFNIIRPSNTIKECPKSCYFYCQISIRFCPSICKHCYKLSG